MSDVPTEPMRSVRMLPGPLERSASVSSHMGDNPEPPPAARLARLFSSDLVREAQAVFGSRLCREVGESEARAMLANLTGFVRLLAASAQRKPHGEAMPPESLEKHDIGARKKPG